jgi:hypothetical protein
MTPIHQPHEPKRIHHSITIDGTDVEITRFVEYMHHRWFDTWANLLNISDIAYDLGHDTLMFTTDCNKVSLIKYVVNISKTYPSLFIMYDYYTDQEEDYYGETVYLLNGEFVNNKRGLTINEA